jgi:hypothetical protein
VGEDIFSFSFIVKKLKTYSTHNCFYESLDVIRAMVVVPFAF